MDGILLAEHLLKSIRDRRERVSEMMLSGTPKDFEEYKQLRSVIAFWTLTSSIKAPLNVCLPQQAGGY